MGFSDKDLIVELTEFQPGIELQIDNQAALSLLQGSSGSWRIRHLRLRSSWIHERILAGEVTPLHESGDSQRADLGTKSLPKDRLQNLASQWGIRKASTSLPRVSSRVHQLLLHLDGCEA